MTPKEKEIELFKNFYKQIFNIDLGVNVSKDEKRYESAKQCALIAVDEIIGQWEIIDVYLADGNGQLNQNLKYWYTVKKEINLL